MSEKRVCAAPRIYMHFFGHFHPPNPPKGRAKARSPLLNRTFRTDSMRPRRIYSAKGAFTLSIDQKKHETARLARKNGPADGPIGSAPAVFCGVRQRNSEKSASISTNKIRGFERK